MNAEDIREIRGPKLIAADWLWLILLAAALALLLCGVAVWWWRRRQTRIPPLTAAQAALRDLERIRDLVTPARARAFCIAASDILRRYLERQFDVTVTKRTTEEFLQDIERSPQSGLVAHRPLLTDFLQRCDVVKFGGAALESRSIEALYDSAQSFVRATAERATQAPAA